MKRKEFTDMNQTSLTAFFDMTLELGLFSEKALNGIKAKHELDAVGFEKVGTIVLDELETEIDMMHRREVYGPRYDVLKRAEKDLFSLMGTAIKELGKDAQEAA